MNTRFEFDFNTLQAPAEQIGHTGIWYGETGKSSMYIGVVQIPNENQDQLTFGLAAVIAESPLTARSYLEGEGIVVFMTRMDQMIASLTDNGGPESNAA